MKEIDTVIFTELAECEEAVAVIRAEPGKVALALGVKNTSDVEAFIAPDKAERIVQALLKALEIARSSG